MQETDTIQWKRVPRYAGQILSKSEFMKWESDDGYVYEWNNGILEATNGMKQDEMMIAQRLTRRFAQTEAYRQEGELMLEIDCWVTDKQMRRPDLAFYRSDQIKRAGLGESVTPAFVIEVISEFDDLIKVEKKLIEYFQAGVQVVWRVVVDIETVYCYTSPKQITVCTDDDVVSAAPVLPDFTLTVHELVG